jgi:hypothetical protein
MAYLSCIRSSVPVAAIAASTAAAVVLILILVGLCYRRRKRVRRLSPFDFSQASETQEAEGAQHCRLPSLPVLPPVQSTGGWDDPPAYVEPARDPFADQVPMLDEPLNASRLFVVPPLTQAIRHVSVPDPFTDPPALVSTPKEGLPSRLSNASSYSVHDPRASVTSSNVRLFSLIVRHSTYSLSGRSGVLCETILFPMRCWATRTVRELPFGACCVN